MLEKQKQIIKVLSDVLPQMSEEIQSYLLGFGEGMAAAQKNGSSNFVELDKGEHYGAGR